HRILPPRQIVIINIVELYSNNLLPMHTAHANDPRYPIGYDALLAAAGAREHKDQPVVRLDGVALRRIQLGEERVAVQHQPIVPERGLRLLPGSYSTVTDFARFRGWSTSQPRRTAM